MHDVLNRNNVHQLELLTCSGPQFYEKYSRSIVVDLSFLHFYVLFSCFFTIFQLFFLSADHYLGWLRLIRLASDRFLSRSPPDQRQVTFPSSCSPQTSSLIRRAQHQPNVVHCLEPTPPPSPGPVWLLFCYYPSSTIAKHHAVSTQVQVQRISVSYHFFSTSYLRLSSSSSKKRVSISFFYITHSFSPFSILFRFFFFASTDRAHLLFFLRWHALSRWRSFRGIAAEYKKAFVGRKGILVVSGVAV